VVTGLFAFAVLIVVYGFSKLAFSVANDWGEKEPDNVPATDCVWRGVTEYKTGCGNIFYDAAETGNPITDWATYCPYCGKTIRT
jgi:hypothetical protein